MPQSSSTKSTYDSYNDEIQFTPPRFKVCVRIAPSAQLSANGATIQRAAQVDSSLSLQLIRQIDNKELELLDEIPRNGAPTRQQRRRRRFAFDTVYAPSVSVSSLYENDVAPLIPQLFSGFNATIIVAGECSARRTELLCSTGLGLLSTKRVAAEGGILNRLIDDIYVHMNKKSGFISFEVFVSCIEVYNESIIGDLGKIGIGIGVAAASKQSDIQQQYPFSRLTANRGLGGQIEELQNLLIVGVHNKQELCEFVEQALEKRTKAALASSSTRSRYNYDPSLGTVITTITIVQQGKGGYTHDRVISGSMNVIECVGAEHDSPSLQALGRVLSCLNNNLLSHDIPYSSSLLTSILKKTLETEDNHLMLLLANVQGNGARNFAATKRTLLFAHGCKAPIPLANNNNGSISQSKDLELQQIRGKLEKLKREAAQRQAEAAHKISQLEQQLRVAKFSSDGTNRPFVSQDQQIAKDLVQAQRKIADLEVRNAALSNERNEAKRRASEIEQKLKVVQKLFSSEEDQMKRSLLSYRAKYRELLVQKEQNKEQYDRTLKSREDKFMNELEDLTRSYQQETDHIMGMYLAMQEKVKDAVAVSDEKFSARGQAQKQYDEKLEQIVKEMNATKEQAFEEYRQMHEEVLLGKDLEMSKVKRQLELQRKGHESELKRMDNEVLVLWEYCVKLNKLLKNIETGVYPVQCRHYVKRVYVKEADKPDPPRAELVPHVASNLKALEQTINECEKRAQNLLQQQKELMNQGRLGTQAAMIYAEEPPGFVIASATRQTQQSQQQRPWSASSVATATAANAFLSLASSSSGEAEVAATSTGDAEQQQLQQTMDAEYYRKQWLSEQQKHHDLRLAHEHLKIENQRIKQQLRSSLSLPVSRAAAGTPGAVTLRSSRPGSTAATASTIMNSSRPQSARSTVGSARRIASSSSSDQQQQQQPAAMGQQKPPQFQYHRVSDLQQLMDQQLSNPMTSRGRTHGYSRSMGTPNMDVSAASVEFEGELEADEAASSYTPQPPGSMQQRQYRPSSSYSSSSTGYNGNQTQYR